MEKIKSRKLLVGIISAVIILANDAFGKPVSTEAVYSAIAMLATYVIGQGIADHGQQGKKPEFDVDSDEPRWEDRSEMDVDDKKELLED